MSRQAAILHIYNDRVQRWLQALKTPTSTPDDNERTRDLHAAIDGVQEARADVVDAGRRVLILWTAKELKKASTRTGEDRKEDPRVVQLVEQHLPRLSPVSYIAGIQAKFDEAEEAEKAKDFETACDLLDDVVDEARKLAEDTIKAEDAERIIAEIERLREKWNCP